METHIIKQHDGTFLFKHKGETINYSSYHPLEGEFHLFSGEIFEKEYQKGATILMALGYLTGEEVMKYYNSYWKK